MTTEYQITNLSDFLKVPAEKQAECLRDFAHWLNACRRVDSIRAEIDTQFPGSNPQLNFLHFTWIDDGKTGISSVSLSVNGKEVVRVRGGAK